MKSSTLGIVCMPCWWAIVLRRDTISVLIVTYVLPQERNLMPHQLGISGNT
jgi:hypothetical protein